MAGVRDPSNDGVLHYFGSTEEDIQGIFVSMENGESDYDSGRKQIESDRICFLCTTYQISHFLYQIWNGGLKCGLYRATNLSRTWSEFEAKPGKQLRTTL
jgi:hypothetical protein